MNRRPTTQDISWILDQDRMNQLELNPPYQRRSVWTRKDRQFFLDTIFRGFPSPAIFLHKSVSEDGRTTHNVVDGKQRLETILDFSKNRLRIPKTYGDARLDGKKWDDLRGEESLKRAFWNYQLPVEMLDDVEGALVNDVFDRLNRNALKLTRQELRHAKFDGWFISLAESESDDPGWKTLGVVTTARARRMADTQFISELLLLVLEGEIIGFDQDGLDELYAKYDERVGEYDEVEDFGVFSSEEDFVGRLRQIKGYLLEMEDSNQVITRYARTAANFYTLWSLVALKPISYSARDISVRYEEFMEGVERLSAQEDLEEFISSDEGSRYRTHFNYWRNVRGANTDFAPRKARFEALQSALSG